MAFQSKEFLHLLLRQITLIDLAQDALTDEARRISTKFMQDQEQRSRTALSEGEKAMWSNLTIQVRSRSNYLSIHWHYRKWGTYKEGGIKRRYRSEHIKKDRHAKTYLSAVLALSKPAQYESITEAERRFAEIRSLYADLLSMRKSIKNMIRDFDASGLMQDAFYQDNRSDETVPMLHERAGNLMLMMRRKLWPTFTQADMDAGFVPPISADSGVSTRCDALRLYTAIEQSLQAHEHLTDAIFSEKTRF